MSQSKITEHHPLQVDKITTLLKPDGYFSKTLKGFEPREQQMMMMANVIEAYNHGAIALIEAGTGTGKSMAYLIPAMLWAIQNRERTVISTNTINLQEQLILKDIPMLQEILKLELKAVLVKGMNNYLCLRKLHDVKNEFAYLSPQEVQEIEKIEMWKETTSEGSKSQLPMLPSHAIWEKVNAESDTCNHVECPHYHRCFFFKARREAQDAHILVANHHLLFADLACRGETDNYETLGILPPYTRIILDEAHNIEDVATECFADTVNRIEMLQTLAKLSSERSGKETQGKVPILRKKIADSYDKAPPREVSSILNRLTIDLPAERRELYRLVGEAFQAFVIFIKVLATSEGQIAQEQAVIENKIRLRPEHQKNPHWKEDLITRNKQLNTALQRYIQSLHSLEQDILNLNHEKLTEQLKGILHDIRALCSRLEINCITLNHFLSSEEYTKSVRWIESQSLKTLINIHLINAQLDISGTLANLVFAKFPTVILCSATLATNKQFSFIRKRLGLTSDHLPKKLIKEHIYDSPFNYSQQVLLAVPTDILPPSHPGFNEDAANKIWKILQASRGNAFVLFTSYSSMQKCYQKLETQLKTHHYHVLKQGDENRQVLLNKFKTTNRSILFGTDSFWEGVDVVGDALRCVIIVKLPFRVPNEPLIQARTEAMMERGEDPFMEYAVPQAIVKFKQGFGRLIRNKKDRGCIVCLDSRLLTKGYGKLFLNSLPPTQQVFAPCEKIQEKMQEFYRKTHYLVAKGSPSAA